MKTYIQPQTSVIRIEPRNLLLNNISIVGDRNVRALDGESNVGLVKENRTVSSYNVWDDDWSN